MNDKKEKADFRKGLFWALLNSFLWGTTFICSRYLMKNGSVDAITISLIRFSIGSGILFLLGIVFYRDKIFKVKAKDILELALLGALGVAAVSVLIFAGQKWATAINAALVIELNPIMILFLGLWMGDKIRKFQYIGISLGLLGCLLAIGIIKPDGINFETHHIKGELVLLAAGLCWACYTVFSKKITKRLGGFVAITWIMLAATVELLVVRLFVPYDYITPKGTETWMVIIYLSIFPTAIAYFAWSEALTKIKLSLLNITQYLTPVFTIILAWILLDESMSLLSIVGACMVLGGVALTAKE
ncbi:MAG: DMT family transporter [Victivallales bacterium]|nr:DMT family transporter [Victivallales bacterium]